MPASYFTTGRVRHSHADLLFVLLSCWLDSDQLRNIEPAGKNADHSIADFQNVAGSRVIVETTGIAVVAERVIGHKDVAKGIDSDTAEVALA